MMLLYTIINQSIDAMTILFAAKTMDSWSQPATPEPVRIASLVWALDGIRWARQLDDDHLSFRMASFFMAGWSLLRDVSPSPLIYVFFQNMNVLKRKPLNAKTWSIRITTRTPKHLQMPWNSPQTTLSPLSMELVDQSIQIVSNSQWWSGILKTLPTNYSVNFR